MVSSFQRSLLGGLAVCAALAPFLTSAPARAAEMTFGPHDVPTVFFIAKSNDKNRVDYGIRLDAACAPASDDAIIPYWREFEKAPPVRTHPLSLIDHIPYGVAEQRVLSRTATGGEYAVKLKQFSRPIVITSKKEADGTCSATARATINGATAQLLSVYAKLLSIVSVDYIDVFGRSFETGAPVTERIKK